MVRSRTYKSICRFRIFALGPALLLMVVSTVRGSLLRVISARPMSRGERRVYAQAQAQQ